MDSTLLLFRGRRPGNTGPATSVLLLAVAVFILVVTVFVLQSLFSGVDSLTDRRRPREHVAPTTKEPPNVVGTRRSKRNFGVPMNTQEPIHITISHESGASDQQKNGSRLHATAIRPTPPPFDRSSSDAIRAKGHEIHIPKQTYFKSTLSSSPGEIISESSFETLNSSPKAKTNATVVPEPKLFPTDKYREYAETANTVTEQGTFKQDSTRKAQQEGGNEKEVIHGREPDTTTVDTAAPPTNQAFEEQSKDINAFEISKSASTAVTIIDASMKPGKEDTRTVDLEAFKDEKINSERKNDETSSVKTTLQRKYEPEDELYSLITDKGGEKADKTIPSTDQWRAIITNERIYGDVEPRNPSSDSEYTTNADGSENKLEYVATDKNYPAGYNDTASTRIAVIHTILDEDELEKIPDVKPTEKNIGEAFYDETNTRAAITPKQLDELENPENTPTEKNIGEALYDETGSHAAITPKTPDNLEEAPKVKPTDENIREAFFDETTTRAALTPNKLDDFEKNPENTLTEPNIREAFYHETSSPTEIPPTKLEDLEKTPEVKPTDENIREALYDDTTTRGALMANKLNDFEENPENRLTDKNIGAAFYDETSRSTEKGREQTPSLTNYANEISSPGGEDPAIPNIGHATEETSTTQSDMATV